MRSFSFAAGPCPLPPLVKEQIATDLFDWQGRGISALELPFTGAEFGAVLAEAEEDLRQLLCLPRSHKVLFVQGGATAQFGLLPSTLTRGPAICDYVQSGYWSTRAIEEGGNAGDVRVIATGTKERVPSPGTWRHTPNAAYCHFTSNESADGLQFHDLPEPPDSPLVTDMTGDFLSRPIPIERFGMVYASAQKSLAAAGLTIIVVRADLLLCGSSRVPAPFDLARQAAAGSKINTPPTFAIIVAARMLRRLVEGGGLGAALARSRERSARLYSTIDRSGFYTCAASPEARSLVNICFRLPNASLEDKFLREAEANGLLHLRGHPRVGGLRASLYDSTADDAVHALIEFMRHFEARSG